jgi:hypothetical protein
MMVKLTNYALSTWKARLRPFVAIFANQPTFQPDAWGIHEPLDNIFSSENYEQMEDVWLKRKGLLFKRRAPRMWLSLEWWSEAKYPGRLSLGIEDTFFENMENVQAFLDFATAIFEWGDMVYGFAAHDMSYERKNVLPRPTMIDGKLIKVGGTDIRRCLPGVYWANFFGRTYIEWFGRNQVLTAPCHAQLPLPDEGVLLLTAPTPLTYDMEKVQHQEEALQNHLGRDAFFDKSNPKRPCRSPFSV